MDQKQDEAAITALLDAFVEGWNAGDGEACARPFAADADFVAVTGLHVHGRELIAAGHKEILASVFRGVQLRPTVNDIRFLRPDVAAVDVTIRYAGEGPFGIQETSLGLVATKDEGIWSIVLFRNLVPFERPLGGPLERELIASANIQYRQ
jgi:uncharacterized protein (TIGR02246 family)